MMAHPLDGRFEGFGGSVALCVQGDGVRAHTGTGGREWAGGRRADGGQRVLAKVRGRRRFLVHGTSGEWAVATRRASTAGLSVSSSMFGGCCATATASRAAASLVAAAVLPPLSSATACWRANSLRRSSSAVSIFWPIHSSIDGLIISRMRVSIVISATAAHVHWGRVGGEGGGGARRLELHRFYAKRRPNRSGPARLGFGFGLIWQGASG